MIQPPGDGAVKIQSLQILRFIAAAMVVHVHAVFYTASITKNAGWLGVGSLHDIGGFGVDIFFVISGFVITMTGPLAALQPSGGRFFWLRWSRVVPFYWLVTAPWIVLAAMAGPLDAHKAVASFLFWPVFSGRVAAPYLFVGWTLCFEMVFYTAVALALIGGGLARNLKIGAVAVLALLALRSLGWPPARFLTNPIFVEFGFGVALAYAWPWLQRRPPWQGLVLIALFAAGFIPTCVAGTGEMTNPLAILSGAASLRRVALLGVPAALLVAGALICEPWMKGALARVFSRLGDASYSLYLVHSFVLMLVGAVLARVSLAPPADLLTLAEIALCVAAGWVAHRHVERPLLRDTRALGKSLAARFKARPAVA